MLRTSVKSYVFFCVALIELFSLSIAAKFGQCTTPDRLIATCVNLKECRYLYNLLRTPNLTQNDIRFLRESQCGVYEGEVLICCADHYINNDNYTPEASRRPTQRPFSSTPARPSGGNSYSLLPKFPNCGKSLGNRIYGGVETLIGEYPWMALVEYTLPNNQKGHYCGGSLINQRYVLTAAHCVDKDEIPAGWRVSAVRLGEWDTRSDPDCDGSDCAPKAQDINVAEVVEHEGYLKPNGPNDIALLRLQNAVTLNDYVMPICLPTEPNSRADTFVDAAMDVAGWGKTERSNTNPVQLKTAVKVKKLSECQKKYIQILDGITLDSTQLCAGGDSGNDSCRGDSGGPLMFEDKINNQAVYLLTGIVSFGPTPCGLEGWPGVYTRVGAFIDWIESKMRP